MPRLPRFAVPPPSDFVPKDRVAFASLPNQAQFIIRENAGNILRMQTCLEHFLDQIDDERRMSVRRNVFEVFGLKQSDQSAG